MCWCVSRARPPRCTEELPPLEDSGADAEWRDKERDWRAHPWCQAPTNLGRRAKILRDSRRGLLAQRRHLLRPTGPPAEQRGAGLSEVQLRAEREAREEEEQRREALRQESLRAAERRCQQQARRDRRSRWLATLSERAQAETQAAAPGARSWWHSGEEELLQAITEAVDAVPVTNCGTARP